MKICDHKNCTGCGICAFSCPKQCIEMQENELGIMYPVIDEEKCVNCGICKGVCPQISPIAAREPQKAYAAWSSDGEERRTSASGGIAAEIYKNAIKNGELCIGAVTQSDFSVKLELADNAGQIDRFKNSKYVFSDAYKLFPQIKENLKNGNKITVIALPCQIAAIRAAFKDNENLTLADVVCHGTTPVPYLREHIHMLEKKCRANVESISFRDPQKGTSKYYFSLFDKDNNCFYSKRTAHGDTYQFGYHRTISYRENCYHCSYARKERVSDLTLSDYKGLGKKAPCEFNEEKVSSVLINTKKGEQLINELIAKKQIIAYERPVDEPILGDPQLRHPSVKSKMRFDFEKNMSQGTGFEKAIYPIMKRYFMNEKLEKIKNKLRRIKRKICG